MSALGDIRVNVQDFVNEALRLALDYTDAEPGNSLDWPIQLTLNDMSKLNILAAADTSQSMAAGTTTLNYPTDFKELICITPTNASSVQQAPLKALVGGYAEYQRLMEDAPGQGTPEWYAEHGEKFYLWRTANAAYTVRIDYYRYHPQTPANILFEQQFLNCIYFGATYYKSLQMRRTQDIQLWKPTFLEELERCRLNSPSQPYITRG